MIHFKPFRAALWIIGVLSFATSPLMAQTNTTEAARWLDYATPVPQFTVPETKAAWTKRRSEIRATLNSLLGKLPPRPKIAPATMSFETFKRLQRGSWDQKILRSTFAVQTLSREDRGDFVLEKFQFDNRAGATVPGYLLLPKIASATNKAPAILYCHQHGGQYGKGGKEELFIAGNPVPVAPGPELAKRGFVVVAIDAYCFGERDGKGPGGPNEKGSAGEMTASKFNLWAGRSLWGMIVRDDQMALDYLCSRPEVDAARVGVTGFSMGATRAWWIMALDDRLKSGVPVACLTRYQNLIAREKLSAHGIYYFVPGMLNHFDTEAVIACIAPRPLLFMTGDADGGSPADGIRIIEAKAKPAWKLFGKESDYVSELYPGLGHKYLPEMWEKTLAWLDKHLKTP